MRWWAALPLVLLLAACGTAPKKAGAPPRKGSPVSAAQAGSDGNCYGKYIAAVEDPSTRGDYTAGGLYKPGVRDTTPTDVPDVDCIAEPRVTAESPSAYGNRSPYNVLGKEYVVMDRVDGYAERGTASYYGNKFHGRKTSNHEVYDMYQFTAAHKTLPLPSFALVTNLDNDQSVVVRVNDRGPFHDGRVIDLSYAAAVKLGIVQRGTGRVEVRALTPKTAERILADRKTPPRAVPTTIATGVPTRIATGKPAPAKASAIDELVSTLPAEPKPATATVAAAGAAAAGTSVAAGGSTPDQPWRYHVIPDTERKPSPEQFEAWMKSRGVHVATGKPGTPVAREVASAAPTRAAPAPRPEASTQERRAAQAALTGAAVGATGPAAVLLQVASFSSRANADRALAQLAAAGIDGASLSDTSSNGRTLWRLRVAAADATAAQMLSSRIAGLGFGAPKAVRD
ncbi:septal ring lytic transglycosylase RlpA family protein [Pseudoxanthomonas composti]|uniref:Endolytic peptidoglycan transglycosylase RlpA n=1 Tax=Pseudoxanthomonas composti TaxID=2137479 RepID=A0A4Q1JT98_9GAMM|nr:septal ring lytic transglycosylase RlpA family protein [Pseudoxanthomonas composti]RXR04217.1 septal ring lytic transglycosylase RlpA family protein [Pseudoxanthomonas composti]